MPLSSHYPNLQQLDIHEPLEKAHNHEQMIDILSRLPSLRILKISPMPASTILPILHKHCPYLHTISLECTSPEFDVNTKDVGKGITAAYLGGEDFYYQQDDLIEFLYEHRNSLKILDFRGTLEVDNALWEISDHGRVQRSGSQSTPLRLENDISSPWTFTQLIDFRFTDIFASNDVPMILWIILNAPNLNTVYIGNLHFQPAVTDAMINLEHLQKVQIEENYMDDMDEILMDDSDQGIYEFFEHHVALENRSTLEHVVFRWDFANESEHTWLHLLPQLRCLKILEFCGKSGHTSCKIAGDCMPIIESILEDCPSLEMLIINGKYRFG